MRINGIILDENDKPFADVNVTAISGSTKTDQYGNFTIDVPGPKTDLKFTHIGYFYDTVPADYFTKASSLQLTLDTFNVLDEVVIQGITKKPTDNTIWWVLGLGTLAAVVYAKMKGTTTTKALGKPKTVRKHVKVIM